MPTMDKVLEYHISRLKDKRPDVLLKTIKELALLGEQAEPALAALEEVFRTATDADVKTAAQKAGLTIHTKIKEAKK